jgi:hypothetical protein
MSSVVDELVLDPISTDFDSRLGEGFAFAN